MTIELQNDAQFQTEVLEKAGKVLVDFWAPWCGPCRMLSGVIDDISESVSDVSVIKVNVDDFPAIAGKYDVMSIPTLVLFKDGKQVATRTGFGSKTVIVDWMSAY